MTAAVHSRIEILSIKDALAGIRERGGPGIDSISAYIALGLGILFFPLGFLTTSVLVYAVPAVLALGSVLYLRSKADNDHDGRTIRRLRVSSRYGRFARTGTVVGFTCMIVVATATGGRSLYFLATAAVVGSLIFFQIFFHRRQALRPRLVLLQIVVFSLLVRGVALATTPGMIGVDAWVHVTDYAQSIRATGRLDAISDVKYFGAPFYHLFVVAAADVFDSTLRTALYAGLGTAMPVVGLLVYPMTRCFLPTRWALFGTAAFAVSDHFVRWGIHIIPNSLGVVFFTAVCLYIVKMYATGTSTTLYGLTLFFALAVVFTHQVSTFITLVVLGMGAITQLAARDLVPVRDRLEDNQVKFTALLAAVLPVMLLNWSVTSTSDESFLVRMIGIVEERIADAGVLDLASEAAAVPASLESTVITVPMRYQLLDTLGLLCLLLISLVGVLTVLQRRRRDEPSLWLVASLGVMLFVTLGLPMLGLYVLLPNRWFAFMYVPMVVIGARGLRHLERTLPARRVLLLLLLFAVVFPGAMLVNEKATRDAPIDERYHDQLAYSESELTAAATISEIHPDGAALTTDNTYRLLFRDWQHELVVPMNLTADGTVDNAHVVYRSAQTDGGSKVKYDGTFVRASLDPDAVCLPSGDTVYSNGDVWYCRHLQ